MFLDRSVPRISQDWDRLRSKLAEALTNGHQYRWKPEAPCAFVPPWFNGLAQSHGRIHACANLPQVMHIARELCGGQICVTPDFAKAPPTPAPLRWRTGTAVARSASLRSSSAWNALSHSACGTATAAGAT